MKATTVYLITSICFMILVGFIVYITNNPWWSFLILLSPTLKHKVTENNHKENINEDYN